MLAGKPAQAVGFAAQGQRDITAQVKLADSLLTNYKKPEDLIGENGLLKQLTKMLVERALGPRWPSTWAMTRVRP